MLMPEAAIESAGDVIGIMSGTTSGWRDDSQHAEFLEQESLMMLAVESNVAGQGFEAVSVVRLLGRLMKAWIIRRRPHARHDRQAQMFGRVDHRPKLRKPVIFSLAALAEVAGNMSGFQSCGIDRRQL